MGRALHHGRVDHLVREALTDFGILYIHHPVSMTVFVVVVALITVTVCTLIDRRSL